MALTDIELGKKAKDGTLTYGEALDYAASKADKNQKSRVNPLLTGSDKLGVPLNTLYKDLKNPDIIKLFTVEGSPDAKNRAYNLQTVEKLVRPIMERYGATGAMETVAEGVEQIMYPQLAGSGGLAGTQRTGLAGERPMQGLLPKEELDKIYAEAIPTVEAEYGKATAGLLEYHKATANRPEQLLGLKKSDVTVVGDTITVKGKTTTKNDHKGRPELSFDVNSRLGRILKSNYDTSTSEYLFDVTNGEFTEAFNKHVSPKLEPFANILPAKELKSRGPDGETIRTYTPVTTPSVIRSIVPRYLLEQYNVNENFVEGMMGHVNPSILKKNYAGFIPQKDLPNLIENPADFAGGQFSTDNTPRINIDLLSDEQRAALASEQQTTILAEERAKQSQAAAAEAESYAKRTSTLAAITPEQIQEAEDKSRLMEEAKIKGREAAKQKKATDDTTPTSNPEARASLESKGFNAKGMADGLLEILGKTGKKVIAVGAGAASQIIPGPVDTAVAGVLDPESMEVAESKGRGLVEQMTGQTEGVLPAVGGIAGVAGEMITGGVADPEAPRRTSQFLASPMATVASGFINRNNEAIPDDTNTDGFLSR